MSSAPIYTIGHSIRSGEVFLDLLRTHGITGLADVRSVPKSRRHPHFSREALQATLAAHGVEYRHFQALGGMREPRPDSVNGGWRQEGFRGYADHMQTPIFRAAIDELLAFGSTHVVAIMCAEAKWWECHRQLTADALVARGADVRHIMSGGPAAAHEVTAFARVIDGQVTYPALV
jgi:uncharacterized protein (DUF488 family)